MAPGVVGNGGEHQPRQWLGVLDPAGAELERQLRQGGAANSGTDFASTANREIQTCVRA